MKHCNFTSHAVEQFIRRWAPGKSAAEAEDELQALYRTSRVVEKTPLGDTVVASGHRPEIRLVIKDRNVCVTVLPQGPEYNAYEGEEHEEARIMYAKETAYIKNEIEAGEKEVADIDGQRLVLAEKKSHLKNRISNLKRELARRE